MTDETLYDAIIVGAGFTGLACARDLTEAGKTVCLLEAEDTPGGLARSMSVGGENLECFYHHWFASDRHILGLIEELGLAGRLEEIESKTALFYANTTYRLSSPFDVLRFSALPFIDRIRLGLLVVQARMVRDWKSLEALSAEEWIIAKAGRRVYEVVWEPLLKGKFGRFYKDVSAVWFWNKLVLRGGTRSKKTSKEVLLYLRGGFARIVEALCEGLREKGTALHLATPADAVRKEGEIYAVSTAGGQVFKGKQVLLTTAPSLSARLLREVSDKAYQDRLKAITYLGNVCLVLILDRRLGENYWTNVNDVSFPFVGIVEHTNLIDKGRYAGQHIVYLSKYLDTADELFRMSENEVLDYCIPHIQRMFPAFSRDWVSDFHVWKAEYAQPLVVKHYSALLPPLAGPMEGIFLSSMAHIYPEDRGTNYAVKMGREAAQAMIGAG